ncbi:endonuclease/exonuclease/phosphatase family protein [Lentzea sp. NPDC003310]|uniref:endonuclease/exonuclease/phosphatase family protein n=1 Tax=Lentzea sp. NPDC003310 TaxID=3154447 RepID=UPI0033A722C9
MWKQMTAVLAVVAGVVVVPAPGAAAAERFWELQLNLCNSGIAGCYEQGRSVPEAAALIGQVRPDLVTVNEICRGDVPDRLAPAMAAAWPGDAIYQFFAPALRGDTGAPVKCVNGQDYGNAVIGRVAAASYRGVKTWTGRYASQDSGNEQRTYACVHAVGAHLACATHLSASSEPVALAQCRSLLFDVVPGIRAAEGISGRTVVGGDFNLEYDTSDPENAQKCVPPGHVRKGDGSVQHVVFSGDFSFVSTQKYSLRYTDHPGFLVRLAKP